MNSSSSSTTYNPMTNYTNPFPENDLNSASKLDQEEHPYYPMMFNFPNSPQIHLEYEEAYLQFLDLLHQHQTPDLDPYNIPAVDRDHDDNATVSGHGMNINSTVDVINQRSTITKKRCSKKDRHSKINTARGPRDRRMRLSLDVARKFFDLQDMLGYDKASQTVEWLLNNSKPAIRELERSRGPVCSASSTCVDDCDVSSSINESTTVGSKEPLPRSSSCTKVKRIKKSNRVSVSRESRIKARERARERASQKRRLMSTQKC